MKQISNDIEKKFKSKSLEYIQHHPNRSDDFYQRRSLICAKTLERRVFFAV